MAEEKGRKGGGAKLSRSQTVTVRLDPQLRYMADMAARSQRRTLSSFIEWAIHRSLDDVSLRDSEGDADKVSDLVDELWDVDEADRFMLLVGFNPDLLTHEEQILWKLITETPEVWSVDPSEQIGMYGRTEIDVQTIRIDKLRSKWQELKATARGD